MVRRKSAVAALTVLLVSGAVVSDLSAQQAKLPLLSHRGSGVGVSPVYEGWYRNPDGTYTLSFGYINRNREEAVEIPVGSENFVEGATGLSAPPTHFEPFRSYGVFTTQVPADFGEQEVVWTIDFRGERYSIPGRIQDGYEIDALRAPTSGDVPPLLSFSDASAGIRGPHGTRAPRLTGRVGEPVDLQVWVQDEKREVTVRWYKYSGPGEVRFAEQSHTAPQEGARVSNQATFTAPGEYVLYVRANNGPLVSTGQEQCCWSNGYVEVEVRP